MIVLMEGQHGLDQVGRAGPSCAHASGRGLVQRQMLHPRQRVLHASYQQFRRERRNTVVSCSSEQAEQPSAGRVSGLEATIRRKHRQIKRLLDELGDEEAIAERLQSAAQNPAHPPYRLSSLIESVRLARGRPALVAELARDSPSSPPSELAEAAATAVAAGADAVAVCCDAEATSSGLADLFTVARSAGCPVLARDWFLHPLQIAEAKEAGAAGVVGVVASVLGARGAPVMSSFAAALGLDAPVEVVNALEVEALAKAGVPFFGIDLAVGLALPGIQADVAKGLLGALPARTACLVGARNLEEARRAAAGGADAVLLKHEMLVGYMEKGQGVPELLSDAQYAVSGDD